ncbi:MAG: hypothetical protein R3F62_20445 [Planctomycetota bacterium]
MTPVPADAAARVLTADDGAQVLFRELWAEAPALVVFLRHFG